MQTVVDLPVRRVLGHGCSHVDDRGPELDEPDAIRRIVPLSEVLGSDLRKADGRRPYRHNVYVYVYVYMPFLPRRARREPELAGNRADRKRYVPVEASLVRLRGGHPCRQRTILSLPISTAGRWPGCRRTRTRSRCIPPSSRRSGGASTSESSTSIRERPECPAS